MSLSSETLSVISVLGEVGTKLSLGALAIECFEISTSVSLFSINCPKPYRTKEPTQEPMLPSNIMSNPTKTVSSLDIIITRPLTADTMIPNQHTICARLFILLPILSNIIYSPTVIFSFIQEYHKTVKKSIERAKCVTNP